MNQNDEVVMRVKLEGNADSEDGLYFRGVALDTFDNQSWSKSTKSITTPIIEGDNDLLQVGSPAGRENLSKQTIYLEPLDTPVLFALPRTVAVQGCCERSVSQRGSLTDFTAGNRTARLTR
ncbi:MAG: DUF3488 domain-containing protein [Pyrinomonadaceae bacterium]